MTARRAWPARASLFFEQRIDARENIRHGVAPLRNSARIAIQEIHLIERELPARPVLFIHAHAQLDAAQGSKQLFDQRRS